MRFLAIEGNTQRLDGGAMFGNAPRVLWSRWMAPDDKNRIPLACRSLFVESGAGTKILFDVGIGAFFEPKYRERYGVVESEHLLLKNLEREGISHEEIDSIVLSHLHFDHAGGLLTPYGEGEPRLLFPNATIWLSKDHFERAQQPHRRERASFIPKMIELLEKSGRLVLIDLLEHRNHPDLDIEVNFHFSHGHTIGLMLSEIPLSDGTLFFCSDLVPGLPWLHLPITMGYDRFPELIVDEKEALLAQLHEKGAYLFFTHDPAVACVKLARDAQGKYTGEPVDPATLV